MTVVPATIAGSASHRQRQARRDLQRRRRRQRRGRLTDRHARAAHHLDHDGGRGGSAAGHDLADAVSGKLRGGDDEPALHVERDAVELPQQGEGGPFAHESEPPSTRSGD